MTARRIRRSELAQQIQAAATQAAAIEIEPARDADELELHRAAVIAGWRRGRGRVSISHSTATSWPRTAVRTDTPVFLECHHICARGTGRTPHRTAKNQAFQGSMRQKSGSRQTGYRSGPEFTRPPARMGSDPGRQLHTAAERGQTPVVGLHTGDGAARRTPNMDAVLRPRMPGRWSRSSDKRLPTTSPTGKICWTSAPRCRPPNA